MIKESKGVIIDAEHKLSYGSLPLREVGDNDVLIKVHSAPINPSDVLFSKGFYPSGKHLPTTCGFEGSGVVVQAGKSAHAQGLVGKKVAFMAGGHHDLGSWSEYVVTAAQIVLPIPGDLSFEEAANCFVNPLTVQGFIFTCIKKGHTCIVHAAAASNLGRMLVTACKQANIELINIVRRDEQVKILQDLGATHILNSSSEAYETDLSYKLSALKPTAFFDPIGGKDGSFIFKHMPKHSTTYCYGALSGQGYDIPVSDLIFQGKILTGYWLSEHLKEPEVAPQIIAGAMGNLATRQWTTTISKKFTQEQFKEALEYYEKNQTAGKVLIQNPNFDQQ